MSRLGWCAGRGMAITAWRDDGAANGDYCGSRLQSTKCRVQSAECRGRREGRVMMSRTLRAHVVIVIVVVVSAIRGAIWTEQFSCPVRMADGGRPLCPSRTTKQHQAAPAGRGVGMNPPVHAASGWVREAMAPRPTCKCKPAGAEWRGDGRKSKQAAGLALQRRMLTAKCGIRRAAE
jgi:hypothetical protein